MNIYISSIFYIYDNISAKIKSGYQQDFFFLITFYKLKKKQLEQLLVAKKSRDLFLYTWVTPFYDLNKISITYKRKKKMVEIYSLVN